MDKETEKQALELFSEIMALDPGESFASSRAWDIWFRAIQAWEARGRASGQQGVEGYKLVPVEPTDEMVSATCGPRGYTSMHISELWPRLLAASPQITSHAEKTLPPNCVEDERGIRLAGPHGGLKERMPSPTGMDLVDPVFNAIWNVTKTWDVNAPEYYVGYCGMNGSHVMLIVNALRAAQPSDSVQLKESEIYDAIREIVKRIEKCGASPELTHAVTLASDLAQAIGNKWNPANKYAVERVRKQIEPPKGT